MAKPLENGIERSDAATVGELLRLFASPAEPAWNTRDLGPLFRHLLETPAADELAEWEVPSAWEFRRLAEACSPPIVTFGDLLLTPAPPVELLALVKRYAKSAAAREGALPREVAAGLYLACIAAAGRHQRTRITTRTDRELVAAWRWALSREWLDERVAGLIRQSLAGLDPGSA